MEKGSKAQKEKVIMKVISNRQLINEWKSCLKENFYDSIEPETVVIDVINSLGNVFEPDKGLSNPTTRFYDDVSTGDCDVCQHSLSELFVDMLRLRDQSHIFHWQTYSHSEHNALSEYYESYLDLVDDLAEMIMGALKERPSVSNQTIELVDYSDRALQDYLVDARNVFDINAKEVIPEEYSEIHNKIEEIVELIDKLAYLITLK